MRHWYDIIFVMIAVWVISDMTKPWRRSRQRPPTYLGRSHKRPSVFMSPRLALVGAAFGVMGLLAVIGASVSD